jgi:hypothetical protein
MLTRSSITAASERTNEIREELWPRHGLVIHRRNRKKDIDDTCLFVIVFYRRLKEKAMKSCSNLVPTEPRLASIIHQSEMLIADHRHVG